MTQYIYAALKAGKAQIEPDYLTTFNELPASVKEFIKGAIMVGKPELPALPWWAVEVEVIPYHDETWYKERFAKQYNEWCETQGIEPELGDLEMYFNVKYMETPRIVLVTVQAEIIDNAAKAAQNLFSGRTETRVISAKLIKVK